MNMKATTRIDIGIPEARRQQIAESLTKLLANTYTLYLKTHNFHWNVTGPHFQQLHALFETHYTELALGVDEVAERIRALGAFAPGSYAQYSKLASIKEEEGQPNWENMVNQLVLGYEILIRNCRDVLALAQEVNDESTNALVGEHMAAHEKRAWMLRSHIMD